MRRARRLKLGARRAVHPRDIAKTGVMLAVGVTAFGIGAFALVAGLGAFAQGLWGSFFGLAMLGVGLVVVVVAVLLFVGGGADVLYVLRGKRGS